MIQELNERSRKVFRDVVETYLETGAPVGSATVSKRSSLMLSPATFRSIMADLEQAGLLYAPHTSAGRMPTQTGLRLFVDGMLEIGDLTAEMRADIEAQCAAEGRSLQEMLSEAGKTVSGLCKGAGLVLAPTSDAPLKHIEFVALGRDRAIVVLVAQNGSVENRVIQLPPGITPAALEQAGNYLNARLVGRNIDQVRQEIGKELDANQATLDDLAAKVVKAGLATWSNDESQSRLIVRGRANLLDDVHAAEELERIRQLFDDLETKRELIQLLDLSREADGVRIFIGSENNLFSLSGSSLVVAPFSGVDEKVIGVIGVIGPTRLNYARVIPTVDYTAKLIGRLLGYNAKED